MGGNLIAAAARAWTRLTPPALTQAYLLLRAGVFPLFFTLSGYGGIACAAHVARGDAFACSPLIKVAFADKNLPFDFANITKEFGRGALREFMPAGERSLIIPAQ